MFKNETHNHPTEIEPFGGAATCLGGAIRDPLSGRAYVYQAMRVTGAADPLMPVRRHHAGQAAPAQDRHHRRGGLQLLRQPDRPGHRPGRRDLPPRLCRQAHGDRRGRGAPPRRTTSSGRCPPPGDVVILLGGAHRPGRLRRRHRLLQVPHRAVAWRPAARRCRRATPPRSASSSACSATPRSPA